MKEEGRESLEYMLLETLSFWDELTIEQILFQMNQDQLEMHREWSMADLYDLLEELRKKKMITKKKRKDKITYKRKFPKRRMRWLRKFFPWF